MKILIVLSHYYVHTYNSSTHVRTRSINNTYTPTNKNAHSNENDELYLLNLIIWCWVFCLQSIPLDVCLCVCDVRWLLLVIRFVWLAWLVEMVRFAILFEECSKPNFGNQLQSSWCTSMQAPGSNWFYFLCDFAWFRGRGAKWSLEKENESTVRFIRVFSLMASHRTLK